MIILFLSPVSGPFVFLTAAVSPLDILPKICAAITTLWISFVPSYIGVILASLYILSTGIPFKYPFPPKICSASEVISSATSDAYCFAIADSIPYGAWASLSSAAEYTSILAHLSFVAISAILNAIACCAAIGFPNCSLSLLYSTASSKAPCAIPSACAAIPILPPSSVAIAILKP